MHRRTTKGMLVIQLIPVKGLHLSLETGSVNAINVDPAVYLKDVRSGVSAVGLGLRWKLMGMLT